MRSIDVDFTLVIYGKNDDTVPVLTDNDSLNFIKWYTAALDVNNNKVQIELIRDSIYRISWDENLKEVNESSLSDPDPYGMYPFDLNDCRCLVVGVEVVLKQ